MRAPYRTRSRAFRGISEVEKSLFPPVTLFPVHSLPYIEATIRESMRFEPLAPDGVPHQALADTEFRGYTIPKVNVFVSDNRGIIEINNKCMFERTHLTTDESIQGTIVYGSLNGCHMDETAFKHPEIFDPERFLDENGRFSPRLDKSMPFSGGKRLCAGETFARNALFLLTASVAQNFNLGVLDGGKMPMTTVTCFTQHLPDFWLEFLPR